MIDEVREVKQYLKGKDIVRGNLYRICYMIAKWYSEQGLSKLQIREKLFSWGKEHGVYIKYNVNNIIQNAVNDKRRLLDNVIIRISEDDIREITKRFDNKKTRLVALAVLCYAKAYADQNREFALSSVALGAWVGIHPSNVKRHYIDELTGFEYLTIVKAPKNTYRWDADDASKNSRYKMLVPISNEGEYVLRNNDLLQLYDDIFGDVCL